jgi:hypothetical protein
VAEFSYLETRNQNLVHGEINSRLNLSNAWYHSVQNLLASQLLSKYLQIEIYKSIILLVVLFGCETWSVTLREKHRLKIFESRVPKRIFALKRDEMIGGWRKQCNELQNVYSFA